MSDAVAAAPAPVKATKKATKPKGEKKPKVAPSHPTYASMIKKAIVELKERNGSSKAAILKYILQHNKLGDNLTQINAHLRSALKRGVTSGAFKQTKGTGASGSFRVGESAKKAVAAPKVKKTKPAGEKKAKAAKKEKKPTTAAKKTTKPKAKKATKPKAPKSPKKVKSPAKKAAAPKKAKAAAPKKAKAAKSA